MFVRPVYVTHLIFCLYIPNVAFSMTLECGDGRQILIDEKSFNIVDGNFQIPVEACELIPIAVLKNSPIGYFLALDVKQSQCIDSDTAMDFEICSTGKFEEYEKHQYPFIKAIRIDLGRNLLIFPLHESFESRAQNLSPDGMFEIDIQDNMSYRYYLRGKYNADTEEIFIYDFKITNRWSRTAVGFSSYEDRVLFSWVMFTPIKK